MSGIETREQRARLLALFSAAVKAAHPSACLPPHLPPPPANGRIIVVGAGKADAAMAVAVENHYDSIGQLDRISGFVTTRHGFALPTRRIEVVEAGHPVPDAASAAAARRALDLVATAGADDLVLVLMSGGASALWTAPVAGVTFEEKQTLTRQLLRSGAPIGEMNAVRRRLSSIKGGRLLAASGRGATVLTLAISDVPGDVPAAIGSGPTVVDETTLADARAVLARYGIRPPAGIAAALDTAANEAWRPPAGEPRRDSFVIVARPRASLEAAAAIARGYGYDVEILGDALEGEAREIAAHHAGLVKAARSGRRRIAILSGGELTVTVKGDGAGGPNQEYALALAMAVGGAPGVAALAADTDGIDGGAGNPNDPAGAMVLPDTLARARSANLSPAAFLANNDSTGFFRPLGDLVECGPTQTNVNDFRVILIDP